MKKLSIALLFVAALAVSACHYGQEEANKSLERNDLYKGDKQEYSVNRAGEGGAAVQNEAAAAEAPHDDASAGPAPADTTAKEAHHEAHH